MKPQYIGNASCQRLARHRGDLKMNKQYAYFSDLPVGTEFIVHGNACKKISTRTASINSPIAAFEQF